MLLYLPGLQQRQSQVLCSVRGINFSNVFGGITYVTRWKSIWLRTDNEYGELVLHIIMELRTNEESRVQDCRSGSG